MAWEILYGRLPRGPLTEDPDAGWVIDIRPTEQEAVTCAIDLIRNGFGVRWVKDTKTPKPKWETAALVKIANEYSSVLSTG